MTSPRVQHEWRARIAAEYTSAAITQQLVLWLIQAGAPPDLIDDGLAIVADELAHSRLSHDVYTAAGGREPPALDRERLGLTRTHDRLELDILAVAVRVFCLGETVAVPRLASAPVAFEVRYDRGIPLGDPDDAVTLVLLVATRIHVAEAIADSRGFPDPHKHKTWARLGGQSYLAPDGWTVVDRARAKYPG